MFFVMSLHLPVHEVLQNNASSLSFFQFCSDFLAFFAHILYFKFLEFNEFNKTIIPFTVVGYVTISYPTRAHGIVIVKYYWDIP